MKILTICTVDLDKNGITSCILNYFNQIASPENIIDIVAPNNVSDGIKRLILNKGMKLFELPMRKRSTVKYFCQLVKVIKAGKYDVIHAHGNSCTLVIEMWAGLLGGCSVRIAHSHNTTCEHIKAHKMLRWAFELSCNGRFACGEKAGEWLFGKKPFVVVKNSVDLNLYKQNQTVRAALRSQLNVGKDEVLLGHVGVFNYQKNHEFLLDVFTELCKRENRYRLVCIGDGNRKSKIEKLAKEHGIDNRIIFTGNISNMSEYMQAIDCLLLPSHYEGVPFVLIEAQAAGVMSIVSNNVPEEVNISRKIKFLPLDRPIWCNEIQKASFNREDNKEKLIEEGFEITENARIMVENYRILMGKNT